jgi:chromosome segregation ATPase
MQMFINETRRAQDLGEPSLSIEPNSRATSGPLSTNGLPSYAPPSPDPSLVTRLRERNSEIAELRNQIDELEAFIREGRKLMAECQGREALANEALTQREIQWSEREAQLRNEFNVREAQRERSSADERIALLNAQLLIVHDDRAKEERGHLAEQAERKRLERDVDELQRDIHNLEIALEREKERVKLRPNEQSLKQWNDLLNTLLKQVHYLT